jgi:hypothetical protein
MDTQPTIEIPPISIDDFDFSKVSLSYDRESDTLMVHLVPRGEPGISVAIDDHLLVRLDRTRQRVLGLQIEGFLISVVRRQAKMLDGLDVAELRGITLEEVAGLRREIGADVRKTETVRKVFNWLSHSQNAA